MTASRERVACNRAGLLAKRLLYRQRNAGRRLRLAWREPQKAQIPDRLGPVAATCRRVLHSQRFELPHRQALLAVRLRQVRLAGIARTNRVRHGPSIVFAPGVETALGTDSLKEQPRSAIAIEPASPARRRVLSPQDHRAHVFPSLCSVRAEKRARTPARSVRLRRGHRPVTQVKGALRPRSQNH